MEIAFSVMLLYSGTFNRCAQMSVYGVFFVVVHPTHILVHLTVHRAHRVRSAVLDK